MKVLIINAVCGSGSTGRMASDMYSLLKEKGHQVKIAYGVGKGTRVPKEDLIRFNNMFGYYMHNALARLTDGAGYYSSIATLRLIRKIRNFDPDVIQIHNLHGYYINIGILFQYLKSSNKKVVWTLHDCWAFTGHSAYCDAIKCEKWKDGCFNCPQIAVYPKAFIDRSKRNWEKKKRCFTGVPNLTIITPSHWLAGLVRQSFLAEYPVEVIHNGIDISQFMPLKNDFRQIYGIEDKFIVLGVASSWGDMKGYSDFIKLAGVLDDTYKVVMVGLNENQIQRLPANVLGIQRTLNVKELVYIYSSSDVFLNLTYCDTYPTVNLEARACGTPVITYDTGGSRESAGETGIFVKQGDLEAVINEIKKLRLQSTRISIDTVQFDQKKTLDKYLELYSSEKINIYG